MPVDLKLLLVEDNPMVMGLLRQALSSLATISTAVDGADALLKAVEDAPDLIITDYQMPGLDGRHLLEKLKTRPQTARVPVVLMASKADIVERLQPAQLPVEDFVEKPFLIKEAVRRIKRVVDRIALEKMAREAPGETVLRGSLSQMNAIDLLQSLELGRKSCSLLLSNQEERCELFFLDGQINHAVYGSLSGDEAVYKVLAWPPLDGSFQIDFSGRSSEQTTTRSTQGLLMEGLRLLDEANRDAEQPSEAEAAPAREDAAATGVASYASTSTRPSAAADDQDVLES